MLMRALRSIVAILMLTLFIGVGFAAIDHHHDHAETQPECEVCFIIQDAQQHASVFTPAYTLPQATLQTLTNPTPVSLYSLTRLVIQSRGPPLFS